MLFWTKLLTIAHAITTSIHPFLPLYFFHTLKFNTLTIAVLTACMMVLRIPASAFWIDLVDCRPTLHGVFTGLLTAVGTAGILLVLSVSPNWTTIALPIAIVFTVLDGLFYQPLEVLIDSAIVKILGDYKILYVNERQFGKLASAIMAIVIGWFLDDDHDYDTLMVLSLVGSVALFLLSLSTTVHAADPSLLDIGCADMGIDETSSLTKHDFLPIESNMTSGGSYVCYKPYSLFGEPLSHISEEDASMVQRMTATTANSISIYQRPESVVSSLCLSHYTTPLNYNNSSSINQCSNSNIRDDNCTNIAISNSLYYCNNNNNSSPNLPPSSYFQNNNQHQQHQFRRSNQSTLIVQDNSPPSFELARLPYPPPESPVVVLITLMPGYYKNRQHNYNAIDEDNYCYLNCTHAQYRYQQQQSKWIIKSFISSTLCLGIVFGMTQSLVYLYLDHTLHIPMHTVGLIGSSMIFADIWASRLVFWIIQHAQLVFIIGGAHAVLIICTLAYTYLQPAEESIYVELIALVLQCFLALSFHLIWLLAAHQVDLVVLTSHKRMLLKGGMAALYSSIGPAIGVLAVGYLVEQSNPVNGYISVYQYASLIALLSAILSWEWSTTD